MSEINQVNENGKPHGLWKVYYENDSLMYYGSFINGLWEWYYSNNNIMTKGYYSEGEKIGLWYVYFRTKKNTIDKIRFYAK